MESRPFLSHVKKNVWHTFNQNYRTINEWKIHIIVISWGWSSWKCTETLLLSSAGVNQWQQFQIIQLYLPQSSACFVRTTNTKNKACWQGLTAYTHTHTHRCIHIHIERSREKMKNNKFPSQYPSCECVSPPSLRIWITWLLLKGPNPGRSVGGDAPNEDEYSTALERLLEGCPASTHGSSQIGDTVNGGGGV